MRKESGLPGKGEGRGEERDGPDAPAIPALGKSSVSSSTARKPLQPSLLAVASFGVRSAGRQETTVVVNWVERDAKVSRDPNPQRTGLNPTRRPLSRTAAPARSNEDFPPRWPHLSGVAVPLKHRNAIAAVSRDVGMRAHRNARRQTREQSGTIFTPDASLRRRSGAKNGMQFGQIYIKRDLQALGIV